MNRSYKDVVSGLTCHVKDLEQSAANNDKEENSQQDGSDLVVLLFFLHYSTQLPLSSTICRYSRCSDVGFWVASLGR
jgi:hypothetical protein